MRLLALLGVFAMSTQFSVCERRNYTLCSSDPAFGCEDGKTCNFADAGTSGIGQCVAATCGPNLTACTGSQPLCISGSCAACSSSAQCATVNSGATPLCASDGSCVSCLSSSDCAEPTKPICDSSAHACRPCSAHSDCPGSGVCAKDDSFATLPKPILRGTCVDKSRVIVVDKVSCTGGCTLNSKLALVSADQPYLNIVAHTSTTKITIPPLPTNLPTYYLIGPTADQAPTSKLPGTLSVSLSNPTGVAVAVSPGANTVFEGIAIVNAGTTGLDCAAAGTATKVSLIRSFIAGANTAINSTARCDLTIDSSWLGKGPSASQALSSYGTANGTALILDSTRLLLVNSVLWKNGGLTSLGGVRLSDSAALSPLIRIVHSTFADQPTSDGRNILAVDCTYATAGVSIVNTLFANPSPPASTKYVHQNCRDGGVLVGVASNDPLLSCPNCAIDISDTVLVSGTPSPSPLNNNGDLHYLNGVAPPSVTTGGVPSLSDGAGAIPIPTTDIEGQPRSKTQPSLGAFEAH